jgi:hypothetical protein
MTHSPSSDAMGATHSPLTTTSFDAHPLIATEIQKTCVFTVASKRTTPSTTTSGSCANQTTTSHGTTAVLTPPKTRHSKETT